MSRPRLAEGLALAGVLGLAAMLDTRDLHSGPTYDEGVYLASLRELEHGAALGNPLFTSQPPGFYWLLRLIGLTGSSLTTLRTCMVVLSLGGLVAAWALVRSLAGPTAGVIAAGVLALAARWPLEAARVSADVPATSFALGALALARTNPLIGGALLAVAVSIKLLALPAVVPFVLLARRHLRRATVGAAVASVVILLPTVTTLPSVWRDAVGFHFDSQSRGVPIHDNAHTVLHFTTPHAAFGLVALLAIATAVVLLGITRRLAHWELWTFAAVSAVFLTFQSPLATHHLVLMAAALTLPVAATLGDGLKRFGRRGKTLALAALVGVAAVGYVQQWRQVSAEPVAQSWIPRSASFLRAHVAPGSKVASDLEVIPYLAGMRQPPQLVDLSFVRFQTHSVTPRSVLRDSGDSAAFVVERTLTLYPAVLATLRRRYTRVTRIDRAVTIYYGPRPGRVHTPG